MVGNVLTEEGQVLVGDGEMEVHHAVAGGVECAFHHVLQGRCARTVFVFMEEEQALGQVAIVHVFEEETHGVLPALAGELVAESEIIDMGEKLLYECRLFAVFKVLEEVLEHTAGSAAGGDKLQDFVPLGEVFLPKADVLVLLFLRGSEDAVFGGSGGYDV